MEQIQIVPKVWGQETIIVNNDLYCGKFLQYDAEAKSSEHLHREKQETFYCLDGEVVLMVGGTKYVLYAQHPPVTVLRGQKHQMTALTACMVLEISTPHDDADVTRFTESERGVV